MYNLKIMVNNLIMIKTYKKVKLIKHFVMEHSITKFMPSAIKDKDITAMFQGLFAIMQTHATNQAKRECEKNESSYNHLLRLYLNAVKTMNKYKNLYLQSINNQKVMNF